MFEGSRVLGIWRNFKYSVGSVHLRVISIIVSLLLDLKCYLMSGRYFGLAVLVVLDSCEAPELLSWRAAEGSLPGWRRGPAKAARGARDCGVCPDGAIRGAARISCSSARRDGQPAREPRDLGCLILKIATWGGERLDYDAIPLGGGEILRKTAIPVRGGASASQSCRS